MEYTLNVPASKGRMGSSEFYTAVVPLGAVVKLFAFDPEKMLSLTPEQRTQRALKRKRVPEIAEYVLGNDDYVFSSITVSVEAEHELTFEPVEPGGDIGTLKLPLDAEFVVNDGQHRVAGIAEALLRDRSLEHDTISVVIFPGSSRARSQQIFSDLNRTVHKTSRSLDILFDHRSPVNRITVSLAATVPLFRDRIDKERIALSGRSKEFTTLSGLQAATQQLLGAVPDTVGLDEYELLLGRATAWWTELTDIVEPWAEVAAGKLRPDEARSEWVSCYSLVLWALGAVGGSLLRRSDDTWLTDARQLADIAWRKTNEEWQGICMSGTEVVTRGPARKATADFLHWKLGLASSRPRAVLPKTTPARSQRAAVKRAAAVK